ncbi:MAG TPA: hypothetical protein VHH09_03740 [Acidimicrobiales bacterium]|nr:hypothetical protein [Acidimicrobiales bacterium]
MSTVEMTDVYRSLVANLRDKLGGTITEANADAIAHAAAQVYRKEVEPRLWEEKSAHQLLDSLGVPRSGAFVPYSLSDRLLLLHRSDAEGPYRAQAHELLDELAVPRADEDGREHSLQARLTLLLGSLDDIAPVGAGNGGEEGRKDSSGQPGDDDSLGRDSGADSNGQRAPADGSAGAGGNGDAAVAGPDLVDALEAIQRAVQPEGEEASTVLASSPPPPPPPPAEPGPDLIGLGGLLGSMQEELVEVRQAVESLRQELRDAVALFQAATSAPVVPVVPPDAAAADGGPEIVVRRVAPERPGDEDPAPDPPSSEAGSAEGPASEPSPTEPSASDTPPPDGEREGVGTSDSGPAEVGVATALPPEVAGSDGPGTDGPVSPHEPTRVLPAVPPAPADGPVLTEEPDAGLGEPVVPPGRSRRAVLLVLLVVLTGILLAAGITAAVVLGWDQLQSRFIDTVAGPATW